jgi:hypothetical protein
VDPFPVQSVGELLLVLEARNDLAREVGLLIGEGAAGIDGRLTPPVAF